MEQEVKTPETTEVVKTTATDLSTDVDMGIADELTQQDCERGRIGIMQSNSDLVKLDKAKQGAIVDFTTGTELGYKQEKQLEFIPIGFLKYWIEKDADTQEFIAKYPAVSENEKLWEEVVAGKKIKRVFHFSYVVLLPQEVKEGYARPYELAFRSTDLSASKKINSKLVEMSNKGIPSYGLVFKLGTQLKTKDKYSWFASTVEFARKADEAELAMATDCRKQFIKYRDAILNEQSDIEDSTISKDTEY